MKSRNNLPHIQHEQKLSWARWKEAYLKAKLWNKRFNWLNLVSDEEYDLILNSDDEWTDLWQLIKPSQINSVYNSDFQNIQLEGIALLIIDKFLNCWNRFDKIDTNELEGDKSYYIVN